MNCKLGLITILAIFANSASAQTVLNADCHTFLVAFKYPKLMQPEIARFYQDYYAGSHAPDAALYFYEEVCNEDPSLSVRNATTLAEQKLKELIKDSE